MNKYNKIILMSSVVFGALNQITVAQEKELPFSFSASAGYEIDSNLTVDTIDNTSNVGDEALVFDASLGYDFIDDDNVGFSAGYDFYTSMHNDLDEFDMTIHGFNLDGRYSLDRVDLGATYMFNTISLGGEAFLDMHTIRPNVGYLLAGNKVYLLGSVEHQNQKFKLSSLFGRNAKRNSGSAKAIVLLGEGRTFNAGYTYSDHDATDDAFSYTGHTFDLSLKLPFEIVDTQTTFRTGYRYQSRGYDIESLSIDDEIRADKRHTFSASLEIPFGNGFSGEVEYEYINSISTFEPVDYNESITTFSVGWEF